MIIGVYCSQAMQELVAVHLDKTYVEKLRDYENIFLSKIIQQYDFQDVRMISHDIYF